MVIFGQNLYLWRAFKGLPQEKLAREAGIPRPNLSAIEKGKREVSLPTLRALAAALGIDPGVLVDGVAPIYFERLDLSRQSLEDIAEIGLGRHKGLRGDKQKAVIGSMLSDIIRNRVNALNGIYKKALKARHNYTANWLMLKAALGEGALNNLLSRLYKHMELKNRK